MRHITGTVILHITSFGFRDCKGRDSCKIKLEEFPSRVVCGFIGALNGEFTRVQCHVATERSVTHGSNVEGVWK